MSTPSHAWARRWRAFAHPTGLDRERGRGTAAMSSADGNGRYDLVVLGSGSSAFAAALRAQELGRTAVMTERRALGGTCVNRGCLPSKNLIEAARLIFDARHPRYPGLVSNGGLKIDFQALIAQKDEVIQNYRS